MHKSSCFGVALLWSRRGLRHGSGSLLPEVALLQIDACARVLETDFGSSSTLESGLRISLSPLLKSGLQNRCLCPSPRLVFESRRRTSDLLLPWSRGRGSCSCSCSRSQGFGIGGFRVGVADWESGPWSRSPVMRQSPGSGVLHTAGTNTVRALLFIIGVFGPV